jgi:hypothetical protein
MKEKPFHNLDGREEKTKQLRMIAFNLLNGEDSYYSSTFLRRNLACKAARMSWMIDNEDLSTSELTQATNAFLGICKKISEQP